MRIRTIKPEFWTSPDVSKLSIEDRLLFIGLWNYVDDNGVGQDDVGLIIGALFPHDMAEDPTGTLARITGGLARLCEGGLVARYLSQDRRFLHVSTLTKWQRIDHPSKPRYPTPDKDECHPRENYGMAREDYASPRANGSEEQVAGSREQVAGKRLLLTDAVAPLSDRPTPSYPPAFETFWAVYPIKRGKGKALKAWQRAIKRSSPDAINAGAQRYKDDPNRDDGYTKYAEGWLNADGWLDEALPDRTNRNHDSTTNRVNGWLNMNTDDQRSEIGR